MAVAYEPTRQMVLAVFDLPSAQTHLVEDLRLGIQLSPIEARQLAGMLMRKADEATRVTGSSPTSLSVVSSSGEPDGPKLVHLQVNYGGKQTWIDIEVPAEHGEPGDDLIRQALGELASFLSTAVAARYLILRTPRPQTR
jgi:hypothetical protein